MLHKIVSEDQFNRVAISNSKVVVKFGAQWCQPCKVLEKALSPIVDNENVVILSVDVDDMYELASKFKIKSVPTLVFMSECKEVSRKEGFDASTKALVEKFF